MELSSSQMILAKTSFLVLALVNQMQIFLQTHFFLFQILKQHLCVLGKCFLYFQAHHMLSTLLSIASLSNYGHLLAIHQQTKHQVDQVTTCVGFNLHFFTQVWKWVFCLAYRPPPWWLVLSLVFHIRWLQSQSLQSKNVGRHDLCIV